MADPYAQIAKPLNSAADPYGSIARPLSADEAIGTTGDVAKSFGSGIAKGAAGIVALPRTVAELGYKGADYIADKLGVEDRAPLGDTFDALPSYEGTKRTIEKVTGKLHEPQTLPGQYAQTAGEMLPNALLPGNAVLRTANVLVPAVASESAGQLTKGTAAEPYARLAGAVAGGIAAPRVATTFQTTTERARQVAVLDAEGVGQHLTAGQRTGSEALRYLESAASTVPVGGTRAVTQQRAASEEFTRAALTRVGENAPRATDQVVDQAFRRIGGEFDRLAQGNTLRADQVLAQDFRTVIRDYADLVPNYAQSPVARIVHDIGQRIAGAGNTLPGETYQAFRSRLDKAARSSRNDPQLQDALFGIRNALDDAMARSLTPADQVAWTEARRQYRDMIVIEKAANGAGEPGVITPAALATQTKAQNLRSYARGQGDFAELARAGKEVMTPLPNSGTAQRANAQGILSAAGAGMGAVAGGPAGAVTGAMAPIIGQVIGSRALMSRPVQAWLGNQAAGPGAAGVPIWAQAPQLSQAAQPNPLFYAGDSR